MASTSPTSIRQLHEGKIATTLRCLMGIGAVLSVFARHGSLEFLLLVALSNLVVSQISATVIIWIPKLLAYGMRHGA